MSCKNHNKSILYTCSKCNVKMCSECVPVSLYGNIFCHNCSDEELQNSLKAQDRKQFYKSINFGLVAFSLFMILIFSTGYYFLFLHPWQVRIPPDDRERLNYYLTEAYNYPKNSADYKRNIGNILRLNADYSNVLKFIEAGEKNYANRNYVTALHNFVSVEKMLPDWYYAYIFKAKCLISLNDFLNAINELKEASELNPDDSKSYILMGEIYTLQNDLETAILQYSKALFLDKNNKNVVLNLAELYIRKHELIKAREFRDQAKRLGADTHKLDEALAK